MNDEEGSASAAQTPSGLVVPDTDPVQEIRPDPMTHSHVEMRPGQAPTYLLSHSQRTGAAVPSLGGIASPIEHWQGGGDAQRPVVNETVLPTGWKLTGEIEVAGPLRVGGMLKGTAVQQSFGSTVTVEQSGSVIGDIVADAIEIQGSFDGHIDASGGSIVIEKTARMKGKISYTNIRMSGGQHQIELVHVPQSCETRDQDTEA